MTRKEQRDKKRKFVWEFFKNKCSVIKTCEAVGIDEFTYKKWFETDEHFRRDIEWVKEIFYDEIEAQLINDALNNNKLALKVLERRRPDRWAEADKRPTDSLGEYTPILPPQMYYFSDKDYFAKMIQDEIENLKNYYPIDEN